MSLSIRRWPRSAHAWLVLILTLVGSLLAAYQSPKAEAVNAAEDFYGRVVGVADGDTVTVLDRAQQQHKLRLAAIDAPETRQAYGTRAKQALALQIFGRDILVHPHGRDKYGRLLADIELDGRDLSLTQLEEGWAWHYVHFARKGQNGETFERYQQAEQEARIGRRGLWQDEAPTPPWDWRRERKKR